MATSASVYTKTACPDVPTFYANCASGTGSVTCVAYPLNATKTASASADKCFNVKLTSGSSSGVVVVDSLPVTSAVIADLSNNSITSLHINGSSTLQLPTLITVNLQFNQVASLKDFAVPKTVTTLDLSSNQIMTLDFPDGIATVQSLDVSNNPILTVNGEDFRGSVTDITARNLSFTSVDELKFPDSTKTLDLSSSNRAYNWSSFKPPQELVNLLASNASIEILWAIDFSAAANLEELDFSDNSISTIEGVKFPASLQELNLGGSEISSLTIREKDVDILAKLTKFSVSSVNVVGCSAPAIKREVSLGGPDKYDICVLKDTEFDSIYFRATPDKTNSPMKLPIVIVSTGVALVVMLVLANILYRRRKMRQLEATRTTRNTTTTGRNSTLDDASKLSLLDDIRNDPVLTKFRVDQKEVHRTRTIAKGGYGVVHLATYGRREIIMKQLLPEKAKDPRAISSFVAEIRLCSALEHPRIVSFLGLTWSTLVDLAILMEYMPNGDLAHLLKKQRNERNGRKQLSWTHTSPSVGRTKLQLALDISEALVYLHSASIVHRDLKAQNVLLSSVWEAKLTDFGVSREIGDKMTAEVGTVSWIAPEILKGDGYGVQADVYSFGVVMSELDTCEKPYAAGIPESLPNGTKAVSEPSNTRIALAVIEMRLQPSFREDCPAAILALAKKCLSYKPEDRPSALQLHQELLAISRSTADSSSSSSMISSTTSSADTTEMTASQGVSYSAL